MSVTFAQRGRPQPNTAQIQNMLNENSQLLQTISDYQSKGKAQECVQYQQILHRNLVYLASIADANQNIQALLPPPQAPQNVMNSSVQHGVAHNTNSPPNQGPVSTMNEMPSAQAPPPPNNFPPLSNVYRGPPLPVNPQRTPANAGPQQYRPNTGGYPQQGPHQSFGNNQYPGPGPGHVPPQPNYNSQAQQPPSGNQGGPYAPSGGAYPPPSAQGPPTPYNQPTPNGYGPPVTVAPANSNYGPPGPGQPQMGGGYQNGPAGYPATSQQPNYGGGPAGSYGQASYGGPGSQNMAQGGGPSVGGGGGYPGGGYPPLNYNGSQQGNYPPSPVSGSPSSVGGIGITNPPVPTSSYAQTTATLSPSASTQTYPSNSAGPNYPPVFQAPPNQNTPPPQSPYAPPQQNAPQQQGPPPPQQQQQQPPQPQPNYGPVPPSQNHPMPPQSYQPQPPPNQGQPPQGYLPQNYPQQGYGPPQSYSTVPVPGQPNVSY